LGPEANAYCDKHHCRGHTTTDCKGVRKFGANPANTASINNPQVSANSTSTLEALQIGDSDSDGLAFPVTARFLPNSVSIIDSGASHHMDNSVSVLGNVRTIPHRSVTVGNGQEIISHQAVTLNLAGNEFHGVLVVPGLITTLLAVQSWHVISNVSSSQILTLSSVLFMSLAV
jgi:hypothetical protein